MSFDVEKLWFWKKKGRSLNLYKFNKTSTNAPNNRGRFKDGFSTFGYPDETIESGLRVEYTAYVKPFIDKDPETTSESLDNGSDGGFVEVTKPSETSHVNLNRMLSLAVVDFIKSMIAEKNGDINAKEYYMKEFYKKLANNQSNEKSIFVASVNPVTSVR